MSNAFPYEALGAGGFGGRLRGYTYQMQRRDEGRFDSRPGGLLKDLEAVEGPEIQLLE